jgi:hypothetical protein
MAEYVLPKRGVAYITYMGLVSQADTKLLIASPTLAAGDFKISKDGGATADLATLPTNTPAASSQIKISLSATEMTADNVTVVGIDAAGAQWCSFCLNIQTATRAAEDLAFPTVSGRSIDVTATGAAGVDWANVEAPTTTLALSGTTVGTVTTLTNLPVITANWLTAAGTAADFGTEVAAAVWDRDATLSQTQGTFGQVLGDSGADADTVWALVNTNLDAAISSRMATYTQPTGFLAATFPTGTVANTTNITAGTITTTTNLTTNNDKTGYALSAAGITAVWAEVITGTTTAVQAMRGFIAALLGKASGLPTTPKYRDIADTKNVIDAVTTSDGNRTTVTLDLT